jgi:glycerol-3-phosphate cytidylyltransferase
VGTEKTDVCEYHIDIFTMGDDWQSKFDYLSEFGCSVVYLERTPEISTTAIKKELGKG